MEYGFLKFSTLLKHDTPQAVMRRRRRLLVYPRLVSCYITDEEYRQPLMLDLSLHYGVTNLLPSFFACMSFSSYDFRRARINYEQLLIKTRANSALSTFERPL